MKRKQPSRKASTGRKKNHISKDGKWETMARPTGLMRYLPSGVYFARVRYKGKLIGPRSLETTDYDEAKGRLPLRIQEWKKDLDQVANNPNQSKAKPTLWREASAKFVEESENLATLGVIQERALDNRVTAANKILHYWPSLADRPVRDVTGEEAMQFFVEAKKGEKRFESQARPACFGNKKRAFLGGPQIASGLQKLLWAAKKITKKAIVIDNRIGMGAFLSPFDDIRVPAEPGQLPPLPSEQQFEDILKYIKDRPWHAVSAERRFCAWAGVNFLSMSGLRIGELLGGRDTFDPHPGLLWEDIREDGKDPYINVRCEKKRKGENWRRRRKVPFYGGPEGPMAELVRELRKRWYTGNPKEQVFKNVGSHVGFNKFIKTACRHLKLKHDGKPLSFSQHLLRHIYATRCIEAGAEWKTVAEWLGHEDGGILAAKIYSSLRDDHSFELAKKLGKHTTGEPREPSSHSNEASQALIVDGKTYTAEDVQALIARLNRRDADRED